jgi:hypothetical protein
MTTKNTEAAKEKAKQVAVRQIIRNGTKLETMCCEMGFEAGYDFGLAAAKEEAWHPIRSEDDTPTEDVPMPVLVRWADGRVTEYSFAYRCELPADCFMPVAWMPIPPYTEPQTGDGGNAQSKVQPCPDCGGSGWVDLPQTGGKDD